jgi:exosome complex RNA-binding protein Csl4
MFSHAKKRVVGVVVGTCDRCTDKLPIVKHGNQWLCDSCHAVYERSLSAPEEINKHEVKRSRFHELVD